MNDVQAVNSLNQMADRVAPQSSVRDNSVKPAASMASDMPAKDSAETRQDLDSAVKRLNDYAQSTQRDLQFSLDESSGRTVITVLDRTTDEVIRQLPNDVTLNLARQLSEGDAIQLFSAQA